MKLILNRLRFTRVNSFINIAGLSVGISLALFVFLWIEDEFSFERNNSNHNNIARVMQNQIFNDKIESSIAVPIPLKKQLESKYKTEFKHVILSWWATDHILSANNKKYLEIGKFMESGGEEILDLKPIYGNLKLFGDPSSIYISKTLACKFFGNSNPIGQIMLVDDKMSVKVVGVFADIEQNSSFHKVSFITSWQLFAQNDMRIKNSYNNWDDNSYEIFVLLNPDIKMDLASKGIKNVKNNSFRQRGIQTDAKESIFLQPMNEWHLYNKFRDGKNAGGRIQFIWLFGIIGCFVLLIACINYVNLITAKTDARAKEVAVRKVLGSTQSELVIFFLKEAILLSGISFIFSILFLLFLIPFFNSVISRNIYLPWTDPVFWTVSIIISLITCLGAAAYPAIFLSSFQPVKVLHGAGKSGKTGLLPRKILIAMQFIFSLSLTSATLIVYRQINFAKIRDTGYNKSDLLTVKLLNNSIKNHFSAFRQEMLQTNLIKDLTESSSPITETSTRNAGITWREKNPNLKQAVFATVAVSHDFGNTVNWKMVEGRDFSKEFITDSSAIILNQSAAFFMALKHPVGEIITWGEKSFHVIGVAKDMVINPFDPKTQSIFYLNPSETNTKDPFDFLTIRLKNNYKLAETIEKLEVVFKKYNNTQPFNIQVVNDEFDEKFENEKQVGKLAKYISIIAIFISCLGLYAMSSFMAELREREMGIRKGLGASSFEIFGLLLKEYVYLVFFSGLISIPITWFFMDKWLNNYAYHTGISWQIFLLTFLIIVAICIISTSYNAFKAATVNPSVTLKNL